MKLRIVIAAALMAAAIGTAVVCVLRLNACTKEMSGAIETALARAVTDDPGWEAASEEVARLWERDDEFLHTLLPHVNLNELEWALGAMPEYLGQRDRALYAEQCVRALQCLRTIRDMERPSWGNIF